MRRLTFLTATAFVALSLFSALPASAAPEKLSSSGQEDFRYGSQVEARGGAATGQKPESKLFYTGGGGEPVRWWGVFGTSGIQAPSAGIWLWELVDHRWVARFELPGADVWMKADVLFDGSTAYVALRDNGSVSGNPRQSLLYRLPYAGNGTWGTVLGPTVITTQNPETLTIAKDGAGRLWVTYEHALKIRVGFTAPGGTSFTYMDLSTPNVNGDDISAVTSFGGDRIGVAWSNQATRRFSFAWRSDSAPTTVEAWTIETAYGAGVGGCPTASGTLCADDHVNIAVHGDQVYLAVKTSLNDQSGSSLDPLIAVLRRNAAGTWQAFTVSQVFQNATRPIVVLNPPRNEMHVFANRAKGVDVWESAFTSPSFTPTAFSTWVRTASGTANDPTGTKQTTTEASGTVVLTSVNSTDTYFHNEFLGSETSPPPTNTAPTATAATASTSQDTPVTIPLSGRDAETCELTFSIATTPANGALGPIAGDACTPGAPNLDRASVTYTPVAGYSGPDSFTFTVSDGTTSASPATISITVRPSGDPGTVIEFRSSSTASNLRATTLEIGSPAGVVAGDVMIAVVDVRGTPAITPPAGWSLIRVDDVPTTMRQAVYVRVAGASEPATHTWTFSKIQSAVGAILAYSGVDGDQPVDAHGGAAHDVATSQVSAPSITTTGSDAMVLGFFGITQKRTFTPPAGMTERSDVMFAGTDYPISSATADVLQVAPGATGDKVAVASGTGKGIGQLLALRPAP
jgi:hypothetical protein